jgi:hypothetical protein
LERSFAPSVGAPFPDSPLLGYEQLRLSRPQLQDIADFMSADVDTVEAARQFAREEHTHA